MKVVIGAGYGDCGKGVTVNALATPESLVVRFNGGAQAGHTVFHNGHRHVFSHFGAGTLKGAETYLSRFFVCHPLGFWPERQTLVDAGMTPRVLVSPACPITTIYDVLLNRMLEDARANHRHGSVGIGFGETLERHQWERFRFTVGDLDRHDVRAWLAIVRDQWVPQRCRELGLERDAISGCFMSDASLERMAVECERFRRCVEIVPDSDLLEKPDQLVFEGAQGLLLDKTHGAFPHVTRSNTGLTNVLELVGSRPLEVYYVTRAYTTRHGAGPLPYELAGQPYSRIVDKTNMPSRYQGCLRFSYLNLDDLGVAVARDQQLSPPGSRFFSVVTCLDQLPSTVHVIRDGVVERHPRERIAGLVAEHLSCEQATFPREVDDVGLGDFQASVCRRGTGRRRGLGGAVSGTRATERPQTTCTPSSCAVK